MDDKFYTVEQAATILKVSVTTIRRRICSGDINCCRFGRLDKIEGKEIERLKIEGVKRRPGPKKMEESKCPENKHPYSVEWLGKLSEACNGAIKDSIISNSRNLENKFSVCFLKRWCHAKADLAGLDYEDVYNFAKDYMIKMQKKETTT